MIKQCSQCKQWKNTEKDFYIRKTKNGFSSQCKQCLRKKANDYTQTDKFIKNHNKLKEHNKEPISYGGIYKNFCRIYFGENYTNQLVFNSLEDLKKFMFLIDNDKSYLKLIKRILNEE